MDMCIVCGISDNEVRLFDAVFEGRMGMMCERCSIIENVPIIKKPGTGQLKEAERGAGVYDRMKRLAGIIDDKKEETFFVEDKLNELDTNPDLELPEGDKLNLIDHYHWEIMKNRRRKGLSQEQLAQALGESEIAIQMIEKERLPENAESLIRKLEQFFQMRFRRISEIERLMALREMEERKSREPVLKDSEGRELERIPEPDLPVFDELDSEFDSDIAEIGVSEVEREKQASERFEEKSEEIKKTKSIEEGKKDFGGRNEEGILECKIEQFDDDKRKLTCVKVPVEKTSEEEMQESEKMEDEDVIGREEVIEIKKVNLSKVNIGHLRELHRKKAEATRQEQIEEQKRIEDRQRLIEAGKEEIRMIKEKENKELDDVLGGAELLDSEGEEKPKSVADSGRVEEFDKELV